jgi:hypothetical protein
LIVTMTSPGSGATVSGTIPVSASVSIVGSLTVAGVQFKLDGANLGGEDTSAPYSVSWNTTTTSNGSHTLTAVARDLLGLSFTSNPVTVTVSNGPPPDTTPPSVAITSPSSGATVSNTITLSANASDNVGVAGVQFKLDGANLGAEDTAAPYSVSWNSTGASNGSHTLTAVARDAAGNRTTSSPVTVTVSNGPPPDTTPPSVAISSPANGATVSGTISVTAGASDNVGIAAVQFFLDGTFAAEDATAPYSVSWDTTTAANGSHSLRATARDAAGNQTTSAPVTVTVSNAPTSDTTPPSVAITSPLNGTTVSGTISVTANASDDRGVAGVQFRLDGANLGAEDTSAPYSVSWNTASASNGSHTLTAIARDAAGNSTTTGSVTVTTSNGSTSLTRFEEDNAAVSAGPAGAWVRRGPETAAFSGGTAGSSNVAGATVTFSFTGSEVKWIGLKCSVCGVASVSIDGGAATLVNTAGTAAPGSAGLASEAVFTASGLTPGNHTLVITVTGNTTSDGAHVIVDGFDAAGSSTGTGAMRIEDSDPAVRYTGDWVHLTDSRASAGTAAEAQSAGAAASLSFSGTGVRWNGYRYEGGGIARVLVDGAFVGEVDTYSPAPEMAVVFSASGGTPGAHTLTIEVTGTKNPASSGTWVIIDSFEVIP